MRTTVTLDDDLAVRLERHRSIHRESFKQALNEVIRAGLNQLERGAAVTHEIRRTRPLALGRRMVGAIDDIAEVLAIAEGEDHR